MRILIVSPKFHPIVGGGETFVVNSAERLHEVGHSIAVAVEPNISREKDTYEYPVYEIEGLSDNKLNIVTATDGLYKLIKEFQPEVIHVHGYFALLIVGLSSQSIPIMASIHSTPVWGERVIGGMSGFEQEKLFAHKILSSVKPKLIIAANDVYATAANKIVGKDISDVSVIEFPYPILATFYHKHDGDVYRKKFRLSKNDILLTLPSRIIERKGIREAVEALNILPNNYYLCLPCANNPLDTNYWLSIKSSVAFSEASDRIIIPQSRILPDEMPLLYAASDIVVMPSYYEGAPVATVEAMASKRPFVGADSQGINGFIRNGENGLLVPKRSIKELAHAIKVLACDKAMQKKFTEQSAIDIKHLSWDVQLPKLISLYQSIKTKH